MPRPSRLVVEDRGFLRRQREKNCRIAEAMRFLDLTLPDTAANLALDEALLVAAEERGAGPSLRLWEAAKLAVVMGASGRRLEDVRVANCGADGVAVARRASG